MKTLKFRNEFEAADMTIQLQEADAEFRVIDPTTLLVNDDEPALVLPPTFLRRLRERLAEKGYSLSGVSFRQKVVPVYTLFLDNGRKLELIGYFSIQDVMEELCEW